MMPIQVISKRFCHAQQDALAFLVAFALSEVAIRFGRLDFVDAYEVYEMDLCEVVAPISNAAIKASGW